MATSLASGALADTSTLQTALQTQFATDGLNNAATTVTVAAITTAPAFAAVAGGGTATGTTTGTASAGVLVGAFTLYGVVSSLLTVAAGFVAEAPAQTAG